MLYLPANSPEENLRVLAANPYPGRFLAMGFTNEGAAVQAYAIGGRSDDSRNRILILEDNIISTASFDTSKTVSRPELTIYDALRRSGSMHIASNGDQTATAMQYLRCGNTFEEAMNSRTYEPDEPNFTPRISGFIDMHPLERSSRFSISLIRKASDSDHPIRVLYTENSPEINLEPGIGYALHTYAGDSSPLLPFEEAPFRIPLLADARSMAELLWSCLDANTRVAVATKTILPSGSMDFCIINAHQT